MDGRRPTGLMYTNTDVSDPAKAAEYNNWYQAVHFPDVCQPGIFVNATMFHNTNPRPSHSEGQFLAMYETFWPDPDAAYREFTKTVAKLRAEKRIHAGTRKAYFAIYTLLSTVFSTERRKRTQSLMCILLDSSDPGKTGELKRLYLEERMPRVVNLGLFHTGSFGEIITGEPFRSTMDKNSPRFLLFYESDIGDPVFLRDEVAKAIPPETLPLFAAIRRVSTFYRASP
ncbi:MAG: hypothetical protein FJ039_03170 [Chloroflexi bacterium]|nr:hypothetical protein [Chloroflexota bacterium]